jgi:hypothetical protein
MTHEEDREINNAMLRYEAEYDFMEDSLPSGEPVFDHFARLGWIFDEDGELSGVPSAPSGPAVQAIVRGDYAALAEQEVRG